MNSIIQTAAIQSMPSNIEKYWFILRDTIMIELLLNLAPVYACCCGKSSDVATALEEPKSLTSLVETRTSARQTPPSHNILARAPTSRDIVTRAGTRSGSLVLEDVDIPTTSQSFIKPIVRHAFKLEITENQDDETTQTEEDLGATIKTARQSFRIKAENFGTLPTT